MKTKIYPFLLIILFISYFAIPAISKGSTTNTCQNVNTEELEKHAIKAASDWLKQLDSKQYDPNWEASSSILKMTISKEDWAKNMDILRTQEGTMIERKIIEKTFHTQLPQLQEGKHFSFKFETTFEKMGTIIESLTITYENNTWKTVGYFIKPKG